MKLSEFMNREKLTDVAFAARIGVAHTTVGRWRRGLTRPDWDAFPLIERETRGAVTAADFVPPRLTEPTHDGRQS